MTLVTPVIPIKYEDGTHPEEFNVNQHYLAQGIKRIGDSIKIDIYSLSNTYLDSFTIVEFNTLFKKAKL